jgi:signal peptidase I
MAGSTYGFGEDAPPEDPQSSARASTPVTYPTGDPAAQAPSVRGADGVSTTSTEVAPPEGGAPKPGQPKGTPAKAKSGKGGLSFVRELPFLLLIAFILALLIKTFLVQAFYIPSGSMVPTLEVGDRVLVNKVVYHLHPPRRGDIIVFSDPHPAASAHRNVVSAFFHWLTEGLGVSTSPDKDFIKRVIGLPGEEIEMKNCVVYINGKALHEPYLDGRKFSNCQYGPHQIPADSLFAMGDNRDDSNDSRYQLGNIPEGKVVGRAFVVIWPVSRLGLLHGFSSSASQNNASHPLAVPDFAFSGAAALLLRKRPLPS